MQEGKCQSRNVFAQNEATAERNLLQGFGERAEERRSARPSGPHRPAGLGEATVVARSRLNGGDLKGPLSAVSINQVSLDFQEEKRKPGIRA